MVTGGNLALIGEHTMQYTYEVYLNHTLKTYIHLLTNAIPIKLIQIYLK